MLGWWADETKGYRLKNFKNRKLITSHNVQFHEDNILSELAQVNTVASQSLSNRINNLINTKLYPDNNVPQKIFVSAQPSDLSQVTKGNDTYASTSEGSMPTEELTYPL